MLKATQLSQSSADAAAEASASASGAAPPASDGAAQTPSATTAERFADFEHLNVALSPVCGVFDDARNPEVSLADALKSVHLDLAAHLYAAKHWARTSAGKAAIAAVPGMTENLAKAIWIYTSESPLYSELNKALRSINRTKLKTEFFPFLRLLITALAVLRKASGAKPSMVNRGVKKDLVAEYVGCASPSVNASVSVNKTHHCAPVL